MAYLSQATVVTSILISQPNILRSVFVKEQWVCWGTDNILRLPSEYQPNEIAVYGSIVGLGCPSGRVVFMEFTY
jgi:hypothetical protein